MIPKAIHPLRIPTATHACICFASLKSIRFFIKFFNQSQFRYASNHLVPSTEINLIAIITKCKLNPPLRFGSLNSH